MLSLHEIFGLAPVLYTGEYPDHDYSIIE